MGGSHKRRLKKRAANRCVQGAWPVAEAKERWTARVRGVWTREGAVHGVQRGARPRGEQKPKFQKSMLQPQLQPVRQSLQLAINDTVFAAGTIHGPALRTWPKCASRPRWPMHAPFYSMRWRQGADGLRPVVQYSGVDALASPFFPAPSISLSVSLRPWSASPGSPAPRTGRRAWIWSAVPCRERRAR